MEDRSNGGMLYHEVQESKLCAVHCVNAVLQGPFFSELDFAALASDLDSKERQMMFQGGTGAPSSLSSPRSRITSPWMRFQYPGGLKDSYNNLKRFWRRLLRYGICRLSRLISQLQSLPRSTPEVENAFICHLRYHWFCIRKVDGERYNFDSLYAASEHLSKFYLSAYLDMLKGFGWSIFVVRGNFPKECPISGFESANGFGQWLSPKDAERITKSLRILHKQL